MDTTRKERLHCCLWLIDMGLCLVVHSCELWCLAAFLSSSTHCFMMCNYESDLIALLPDLSFLRQRDHSTFTTTRQFTSPKHTVDTFEGYMRPDRQIYLQGSGGKRERERVRSSMCLKSWTKHTEQGRMILIVSQSLSSQCLLQLAPARFTSPALM